MSDKGQVEPRLVRRRVILGEKRFFAGCVDFIDSEGGIETYALPRDVWEDMGSLDTITVTIKPGDALNE